MFNKIWGAFIIGVVIGIIGHLLMLLTSLVVPSDLVTPVAMLIFSILSTIVIANGTYIKIAAFGGEGAAIPLSGLMFGAAMVRAEAQIKGDSAGKAIMKGFWSIFTIVGIGLLLCIIIGLFSKNPGSTSVESLSLLLQFVASAVFGGLTCAITQILSNLKIPFPIVAEIIVVGFGGFLTWAGLIPTLQQWGAGGVNSTGIGCGNGAYIGAAIFSSTGVPIPLIIAISVNVIIIFIGALAGGSMMKKMPPHSTD